MSVTLPPELATLLHKAGGRWPEADEDSLHELAKSWRTMGTKLEALRTNGASVAKSVTESHRGQSIEAFSTRWKEVDAQLGRGALAAEQMAIAVDGMARATLSTKSATVSMLAAGHAQQQTLHRASAGMTGGALLRIIIRILGPRLRPLWDAFLRNFKEWIKPLFDAASRALRAIADFFRRLFGGKKEPPKPPPKPTYRRDQPLPHARQLIRNGTEWTATGRGGGKTPRIAQPNQVLYRRDQQTGDIRTYSVYDDSGYIIKRVDLQGKPHGGVPTPHTQHYRVNTNPKTGQVRMDESGPAIGSTPKEIP